MQTLLYKPLNPNHIYIKWFFTQNLIIIYKGRGWWRQCVSNNLPVWNTSSERSLLAATTGAESFFKEMFTAAGF